MAAFKTWWRSADEYSSARVLSAVFIALAVRVLLVVFGFDRLTAIDVWQSGINRSLFIFAALTTISLSARGWFGPMPEIKSRLPFAHLWRDRYGLWCFLGAAWITLIASTTVLILASILGAVAQHSNGKLMMLSGTVSNVHKVKSPRAWCRERTTIVDELSNSTFEICTAFPNSAQTTWTDLRPGLSADVKLRETPFGKVVLAINPRD